MLELLSAPGASADLRDLAALPVGQISPGGQKWRQPLQRDLGRSIRPRRKAYFASPFKLIGRFNPSLENNCFRFSENRDYIRSSRRRLRGVSRSSRTWAARCDGRKDAKRACRADESILRFLDQEDAIVGRKISGICRGC